MHGWSHSTVTEHYSTLVHNKHTLTHTDGVKALALARMLDLFLGGNPLRIRSCIRIDSLQKWNRCVFGNDPFPSQATCNKLDEKKGGGCNAPPSSHRMYIKHHINPKHSLNKGVEVLTAENCQRLKQTDSQYNTKQTPKSVMPGDYNSL